MLTQLSFSNENGVNLEILRKNALASKHFHFYYSISEVELQANAGRTSRPPPLLRGIIKKTRGRLKCLRFPHPYHADGVYIISPKGWISPIRSVVDHHCEARYTPVRDEIQARIASLMIYAALCASMIYHCFAMDKKIRLVETSRIFWQGQKDLNPRPMVLETSTLPTELYPYIRKILY